MIMSIILTASNFLFPLITFSYVSRILTPIGTGKVAFASSIISYFFYIAILGIPSYGLREAAKVRDDKNKLSKLVHELLLINIVSTIVSYILLLICIIFISKLNNYKLLFLIMSFQILLNTLGVEWLYNALEEYSYITTRSLIFKIIYIPLVFLLIKNKNDYLWYGFLTIFVSSANYICNFINIHKYIRFQKYENYNFKKHLKPILILFASSIIISIYANFDVSMIGFIRDEFEVGLYNTALKIKSIVLSLSTAITAVLIPRISYYLSKKDFNKIKELSLTSIRTSLLLAFPLTIYIFIYSKNVILFLSGSEYIGALKTLRVLMLCILPLMLTNLFGNQLLIPFGKEKRFSQSVFVGMFINLTLNLLLIPKYGSYGAAIGTFVTECWNVFWMASGVKEYACYIMKNAKIILYMLASIVSSFCSYIIYKHTFNLSIFLQLFITASIFLILYYVILFIFKEPLLIKEVNNVKNKVLKNGVKK